MGKRTKKSGDRSRLKKKGSLTGGCQEGIWQNSFMDGKTRSTKGRGRDGGTKIGPNRNIPRDEES